MSLLVALHRWIGLALAACLLVVAATGVLLLARGPYHRWQHPSFGLPVSAGDQAAMPAVIAAIEARFGDQVRTIKVPQPGMRVYHVWLSDGSEAFLHARTGALIDRWRRTERLPAALFDLHAHLMAGHRGELLNGVIAVLATLFLVIGGVLVWWPRRGALRITAVWPRAWAPGPLLRSHAAIGTITAAPLLLFVGTGAAMALAEYAVPALSRTLDARPAEAPLTRVAAVGNGRAPWSTALDALQRAFPREPRAGGATAQVVFISPSHAPDVPHVARVRLPGEWHPNGRSVVVLHPGTGRVLQAIDARQQGLGTRIGYALYPLHAARIGASASWLLVTLAVAAGVGLAALSLSGLVTWWQRARARARSAAPTRELRPNDVSLSPP